MQVILWFAVILTTIYGQQPTIEDVNSTSSLNETESIPYLLPDIKPTQLVNLTQDDSDENLDVRDVNDDVNVTTFGAPSQVNENDSSINNMTVNTIEVDNETSATSTLSSTTITFTDNETLSTKESFTELNTTISMMNPPNATMAIYTDDGSFEQIKTDISEYVAPVESDANFEPVTFDVNQVQNQTDISNLLGDVDVNDTSFGGLNGTTGDILRRPLDFCLLVSIVSTGVLMVVCIALFSCIRSIWCLRTTIHRQLCLCLLVTQIAFGTAHLNPPNIFITVLLHYGLMCTFIWLCLESYHLYLTLTDIVHTQNRRNHFYVIAYVIPLVILCPTAALLTDQFENEAVCVVKADPATLAVVFGPIIIAVAISTILCVLTASIAVKNRVNSTSRINGGIRSVCILTCCLLICWSMAFLPIYLPDVPYVQLFNWSFAGLNFFCGFYIFISHFLFNHRVQSELRKYLPDTDTSSWLSGHHRGSESPQLTHHHYSARRPNKPALDHLLLPQPNHGYRITEPTVFGLHNPMPPAIYGLPEWPTDSTDQPILDVDKRQSLLLEQSAHLLDASARWSLVVAFFINSQESLQASSSHQQCAGYSTTRSTASLPPERIDSPWVESVIREATLNRFSRADKSSVF